MLLTTFLTIFASTTPGTIVATGGGFHVSDIATAELVPGPFHPFDGYRYYVATAVSPGTMLEDLTLPGPTASVST